MADRKDWEIELVPDWEGQGPRILLKLPENPLPLDPRGLETMGLALIAGKLALERLALERKRRN